MVQVFNCSENGNFFTGGAMPAGTETDNRIAEYLISRGYTAVSSSIPQVRVFFRVDGELAMVVMLLDGRNMIMSPEAFRAIKEKTSEMFNRKGYTNIRVFSLFLTYNVMNFGVIGAREELSWIIDLGTGRLCILDNEVVDFDALRFGIESILEESRGGGRTIKEAISGFFLFPKAPVTLILIMINLIVFIALSVLGTTTDSYFMVEHGALSLAKVMGNYEVYRVFTAVFMHFGFEHLAANMLALWVFGERVENALGKIRFVLLYLLSGIAGNIVSLLVSYLSKENVVSAGASGAIFGIIGALFAIVIKNSGKFAELTGGRAVLLLLYSIFSGFSSEGIDNAAHIGGLAAGLLLGFLFYRTGEKDDKEAVSEGKEAP